MSDSTTATTRVRMTLGNYVFRRFIETSIERDLQQIAGRFRVKCVDEARTKQALLNFIGPIVSAPRVANGLATQIALDGTTVLIGWIEKVRLEWDGKSISAEFTGRDRTGDLVDCAALPKGPAEFRGVDLLHVCNVVCQPFSIPCRADVDQGAPFDRLSCHPHQTGMQFLESASRQRAVLLTSDGIGGLLLTKGGNTRAPAPLRIGENIEKAVVEFDWTKRFSDYFVKGHTTLNRDGVAAPLDHTAIPLGTTPPAAPAGASDKEASAIVMTGHAIDPEILRWRPTVLLTRTQSGMSSVDEQAEWALRVARGQSESLEYSVLDWRAGPDNNLWLPNQKTAVWDPYGDLDKDMLIAGCHYTFGKEGHRTEIRLVGVTAYDRINEADRHRSRHPASSPGGPLTSTATPLIAP